MSDEAVEDLEKFWGKRVYAVDVEITLTMLVVAGSEKEANEIGLKHYEEDMVNDADRNLSIFSRPLKSCPESARGVIPWGLPEDDTRIRCVEDWFEEE